MKILTVVGTLAMFLVGGGIIVHGITPCTTLLKMLSLRLAGWCQGC